MSRLRAWFIEQMQVGAHLDIVRRIAAGERLEDILPTLPVAPLAYEATAHFQRALDIYERLGDRQGAMSAIIAMAYTSWGPEIHLPGSVKRIEEMRRLMTRMKSLTTESERALADAQMLFGAHIYARAKVFPDVAIAKGEEAYTAIRTLGDRSLEFALAGSMALAHAELVDVAQAERWLGRAAVIASTEPTAQRARQLESWRGVVAAAAGDISGMREHLSRAVQLATDQGRAAARCEMLALLALNAARMGSERKDDELLTVAERSAEEAKKLMAILPGHAPWGARADAALARVAVARELLPSAVEFARTALAGLDKTLTEDPSLEIVLPAADAILKAGSDEDVAAVRDRLSLGVAILAQRILDEDIRVRWFRSPVGRELTRLAGSSQTPDGATGSVETGTTAFADSEVGLLRLLTEGLTNQEIAAELGLTEDAVARQLAELFVKIGVSSRAEATVVALMGKIV